MRGAWRPIWVVAGMVLVLGLNLGSQVRPLDLEEMTARAAMIFSGRCVEVRTQQDPQTGQRVSLATFVIDQQVKGTPAGRVTIKMPTVAERDARNRAGSGTGALRRGDEVVLFLYGESAAGLTSPVGLGQGRFSIVEDKQGRRVAVNGYANRHLLRGLSEQARARLGPLLDRSRRKEDRLEATELVEMARRLTLAP